MICLALAIPFLALPFAAGADEEPLPAGMTLESCAAQPRQSSGAAQDKEEDRMRPQDGSMPVMEYLYRYSELEAGFLYTDWAGKLRLDSHVGGYVRYGVGLLPGMNANITFRYADLDNSELTGSESEHVLERALLAGVGVRWPLSPDFALTGNAAVGLMRFDSRAGTIGSSTGPAFAVEAAFTVRLWEMLRLKLGLGLDFVRTDFHNTSADWSFNLTYLIGFELGG
jgi:hypothetical protein